MKHATLSALILAVTGCASATVPAYVVSARNVETLRSVGRKINVGKFVSVNPAGSLSVGFGGKVYVPGKWTFAAYIQHAMSDELRMANLFSASAPTKLTGLLEDADFSMYREVWTVDLVVTSSNGKAVRVKAEHDFQQGHDMRAVCTPAAQAFVPAVQQLLGNLYTSPEFRALVSTGKVAVE